jgi:cytochrome P450
MMASVDASSAFARIRAGENPFDARVRERDGFPVLPGALPVVGHTVAAGLDEIAFVRKAVRRFGPVFWWHTNALWQIVWAEQGAFSLFKDKLVDSSYMGEPPVASVLGGSVIAHDGAPHAHMRGAMNGPFQPKGIDEGKIGEMVAGIVEDRVQSWRGRQGVRVLAETREMALDVMFRLVGIEDDDLSAWRTHYEELLYLFVELPFDFPGSPRRRGLRARAWIDEQLRAIVRRARERDGKSGLLPLLLSGRDEHGDPLSDQELVDNLRLVLLAGHETSASTMAWIVAHLATQPEVLRRVRAEALDAGDLPRSPRRLRDFPYTEGVFRETLRLAPPVCRDGRRAAADFELRGRTVKKGTMLTIPIGYLSRDPSVYEDPDAFRPERWAGRLDKVTPFERMQFGGGAHFCLGYHLAWLEIVAFTAALARATPEGGLHLDGPFPAMRYLPLLHPSASMRASFAPAAPPSPRAWHHGSQASV